MLVCYGSIATNAPPGIFPEIDQRSDAITREAIKLALLRRQLLFDVGVHSIGKTALLSEDRITLGQNIFSKRTQAALSRIGRRCI